MLLETMPGDGPTDTARAAATTRLALIQARMSSKRLPGKVLADLGGRPVLAWVVDATRRIPGLDRLAVATSSDPEDDAIVQWCGDNGVICHRGSLDDVLGRFAAAAKAEGLGGGDVVMRITADCPLLDPAVCGMVLRLQRETGADYTSNTSPRSWPNGLDCELVRAQTLYEAAQEAVQPVEREHVTPFIIRNRHRFPAMNLNCPVPGLADEHWTLDRPADLAFLRKIVERLDNAGQHNFMQILAILDADPVLRQEHFRARKQDEETRPVTALAAIPVGGFKASERLLDRAVKTVPLGTQTFSKSHLQFPRGHAPLFLTHGDGGRVFDVDGNEYVDLSCGLLSVSLGYRDPDVDAAIRAQLDRGISFSLATALEAQLAERLVELIPAAEMVRFGKNGSDATSAAIRIARAATGRDRIAVCGYHGWHDWYIGATTRDKGVPDAVRALTHCFPYNDLDAVDRLFRDHPGEFAAVILEPMTASEPDPGYLEELGELSRKAGAIYIFDEIISAFRFHLGGAQAMFGVTPDLATVGKGMANGMPLSAVVGKASLMAQMEEVFFSGTFGGEALSLAAAMATIDKMRRLPVIEQLWRTGLSLSRGLEQRIADRGLSDVITVSGKDPWRILRFHDHPSAGADVIKTRIACDMFRSGVLLNASHNICYAHTAEDVSRVLAAYDVALEKVSRGLRSGNLEAELACPVVKPIFKVRP